MEGVPPADGDLEKGVKKAILGRVGNGELFKSVPHGEGREAGKILHRARRIGLATTYYYSGARREVSGRR